MATNEKRLVRNGASRISDYTRWHRSNHTRVRSVLQTLHVRPLSAVEIISRCNAAPNHRTRRNHVKLRSVLSYLRELVAVERPSSLMNRLPRFKFWVVGDDL